MFAGGDCIHVDNTQLAYLGMKHGELCASNIGKLINNSDSQLQPWKADAGFPINIVGLGKKNVIVLFKKSASGCVPGSLMWFKTKEAMKTLKFPAPKYTPKT